MLPRGSASGGGYRLRDNHDPRSGANVIGRGIVGSVKGELVVASPLYKQHYCLRSGRCLEDPAQVLRTWTAPARLTLRATADFEKARPLIERAYQEN